MAKSLKLIMLQILFGWLIRSLCRIEWWEGDVGDLVRLNVTRFDYDIFLHSCVSH